MSSMKVMDAILNRRTIRKYLGKPVPEEIVLKILEAGQRAPCGSSMQKYSIIWVKNEEKRRILWDSCMRYQFILDAPVTLAICGDLRNLIRMIIKPDFGPPLEEEIDLLSLRHKLRSIFDAGLVAENMTIAAEAYGLGSVFIGSAFANLNVIETLSLPRGVIPLCLLCIGYPDEDPPLRPRLPSNCVLFVDEYRDLTEDEIEYGAQYMDRARVNWIERSKRKLSANKERERKLTESLIKTGYLSNDNVRTYLNQVRE